MGKKIPAIYRQQRMFPDPNVKQARWLLCQDVGRLLYHSGREDCEIQEFHAKLSQEHDYQIPIIQLDKAYENPKSKK